MFGKILAGVGVALAVTATGIYVATGSVPGAQSLGEMFDGPSGCPSQCSSKSMQVSTCPMSASACTADAPVDADALAGLTGGVSAPAPAVSAAKSQCCTEE